MSAPEQPKFGGFTWGGAVVGGKPPEKPEAAPYGIVVPDPTYTRRYAPKGTEK